MKAIRWAIPTDVQAAVGDAGLLTPGHVSSWREKGYALVQGLLPDDLVTACRCVRAHGAPGRRVYSVYNREEAIQALQTHNAEDFGSGGKLYMTQRERARRGAQCGTLGNFPHAWDGAMRSRCTRT